MLDTWGWPLHRPGHGSVKRGGMRSAAGGQGRGQSAERAAFRSGLRRLRQAERGKDLYGQAVLRRAISPFFKVHNSYSRNQAWSGFIRIIIKNIKNRNN